jgi:cytochrome c oxidase cbb3-type subunit 3
MRCLNSAGARAGARLAVILGACLAVAACESKSTVYAAAGSLPPNAYFIGPQPGPDRTMAVPVNPYANDESILGQGRQLFFQYNCAGCHGGHGGGGMAPSLRDTAWLYGSSDQAIFASIAEGRQHGMPSWGSKLPREQIWMLVNYIKSLRTPNEPDPPRQ